MSHESKQGRDWHGGRCRFCGVDMYDDGVTPDSHRADCVWVMAWNATG